MNALAEAVTPEDLFDIRNHLDIPILNGDHYSLQVNGEVTSPINLTLAQIMELHEVKLRVVMECAGNGRTSLNPPIKGTPWDLGAISQGNFSGVPLRQVLELAGYSREPVGVKFTGADRGEIFTGENTPMLAASHWI